jgi:ethanolamine-phosphate cytidylyltransferase
VASPIPCFAVFFHVLSRSGVPYDLSPEFVDELFTKHSIDYIIHGDDPCLLPDGTDAYAHAKKLGRFKMVRRSRLRAMCIKSRKLRMCRCSGAVLHSDP